MKKTRKPPRIPVAVRRLDVSPRLIERVAGIAVILVILALFLLVRAHPEPLKAGGLLSFNDLRAEAGEADTVTRTGTVTASVSTMDVLEVLGANPDDAAAAAVALRQASPAKGQRLRAGTPLSAWFETGANGADRLAGVSAKVSPTATLVASRRADGSFQANLLSARTTTVLHRVAGRIDTTLADAIIAGGGSRQNADMFAGLFPEDATLGKGGRKGERFDAVIEMVADERGNFLEAGDLVFAAFNGQQASGSWYRFTPEDTGLPEFYSRSGIAGDEFLLRDPVRGAVVNSGFGNRVHPITGEMLLHAGIDFPAPTGTPIRAAGSGMVTDMRWGEGYGWFVRIRHERGYETVYAHMSGFAEGLTPGRTVMRGDTIGYVGSTGSSTGSHLHYEILRNGFYVNPVTLALPTGRDLSVSKGVFAAFEAQRDTIDTFRNQSSSAPLLAATSTTATRIASAPAP
ncbi:M23 family metallopeptidase [Hyphomonas sp. WL0036]|uniref:M23 family metallopeptidase n=1 Tax=Hyphomonas sediminis TaxID=2866160 RepID=UPI001C80664D|nr:M23 family metallopeptidase [Hyphomonas sediminis]MBY9065411.1 M23 family metallopeptidase [Hyphomonas sediminis]